MAFPTVEEAIESSTNTAGTSHVVTLPTATAGQLLLIILDKGSTAATINAHASLTELLDENSGNGLYIAYRWMDGTEPASYTLTSSGNTRSARIAYRISGAEDPSIQEPVIGTTGTGTSATPNPPASAAPSGTKDYLFIAFAGMAGEEADDDTWGNTPPTNYTPSPPRQKSCGTAGTNLGGLIVAAERQLNTGSAQDPGTFGVDVSAAWRSQTILVYPLTIRSTDGAISAQSATAAGSGTSSSSSTDGAISADSATADGSGTAQWVASGTLAAQSATVSGSGTVEDGSVSGTGALAAQSATVAGSGLSSSSSTDGAISAQAATVAGSGLSTSLSTDGAVSAQSATVAGAGLSTSLSTDGAISASSATMDGEGVVEAPTISGTGALVAQAADVISAGLSVSLSTDGAISASSATVAGAGLSRSFGTGVLSAGAAQADGSGITGDIEGEEALVAGSAVVDGVGSARGESVSYSDVALYDLEELRRRKSHRGQGMLLASSAKVRGVGEVSWESQNTTALLLIAA